MPFGEYFFGVKNAHRIGHLKYSFKTILLGMKKIKTPDNHKIKGFLNRFGTVLVEPEGFEPSSKQAITMLSTCVVSA